MRCPPLFPALLAVIPLSACTLFRSPPASPGAEGAGAASTASTPSSAPATPPAPGTHAPAPGSPVPPSASGPAPPPPRQFHLGPAASALVAQAHQQAAAGDTPQAAATLERALRIEPENPLVWIELGRVRLAENNAAQADAMGRKALTLASGDPAAQSSAWHLVAESLRARGNNGGAAEAERRATSLAPQ